MTNIQYASDQVLVRSPRRGVVIVLIGAGLALLATIASAAFTYLTFWTVPPGSPIRPMGWSALMFLICGGTLLVTGALCLVGLIVGWRWKRIWVLSAIAFLLAFGPLMASWGISGWISDEHHLVWEP